MDIDLFFIIESSLRSTINDNRKHARADNIPNRIFKTFADILAHPGSVL